MRLVAEGSISNDLIPRAPRDETEAQVIDSVHGTRGSRHTAKARQCSLPCPNPRETFVSGLPVDILSKISNSRVFSYFP
jgi:hypothetical protein